MAASKHNAYLKTATVLTVGESHPAGCEKVGPWRAAQCVRDLPDRPGCYAVYHDGRLVYIGSSVSLLRRVSQYFSARISRRPVVYGGARHTSGNVTVKIAESLRRGEWLMREYRLIQRLRPRDNKLFTGTLRPRKERRALTCLGQCRGWHWNIAEVIACEGRKAVA